MAHSQNEQPCVIVVFFLGGNGCREKSTAAKVWPCQCTTPRHRYWHAHHVFLHPDVNADFIPCHTIDSWCSVYAGMRKRTPICERFTIWHEINQGGIPHRPVGYAKSQDSQFQYWIQYSRRRSEENNWFSCLKWPKTTNVVWGCKNWSGSGISSACGSAFF